MSPKGYVLKPFDNGRGYLLADTYCLDGSRKCWAVHSAVALMFLGEKTDKTHQINHKDGNKKNNKVENLEYITASENVIHSMMNGKTIKKLTPEDVDQILILSNKGRGKREISNVFNITPAAVYLILSGKTWGHRTGIKYSPGRTNGEFCHFSKLTEEKVVKIKSLLIGGKHSHSSIARMFKISRATIGDIHTGKSWKHVTENTAVI